MQFLKTQFQISTRAKRTCNWKTYGQSEKSYELRAAKADFRLYQKRFKNALSRISSKIFSLFLLDFWISQFIAISWFLQLSDLIPFYRTTDILISFNINIKNCMHFTILLLHETFMPWILSSLMRFEWSKVMWNLLSKTSVFKLYRVRIEFYYLIQFLIELKMKLGFGLIAFAAASKQYIIGGYEPSPNSEKYIVSLQRGGSHFCGGTVISSSKSLSF